MNSSLFKALVLLASVCAVASANAKTRHARAHLTSQQTQTGFWDNSGFGGGGSRLAGHRCSARDTDPVVCKACAIYGEDNRSSAGMHAVGGVIETRVQTGKWGGACGVVHAPGQFVGAWHTLPTNPAMISALESAASSSSANGYMGFRSYCKKGRSTRIGGNCYGTADASRFIVLDPTMTAEDVDLQAMQNLQFAEAYAQDDEG